jgi:hypothetical protein
VLRLSSRTDSLPLLALTALLLQGCDGNSLKLLRSSPVDGETGVSRDRNVELTFNHDVFAWPHSLSVSPEAILDHVGFFDSQVSTLVLAPRFLLAPDTEYTLTVTATGVDGETQDAPVRLRFVTGRTPASEGDESP